MARISGTQILLDEDRCIGCFECERICAGVFRISSETGLCTIIETGAASRASVADAIHHCPSDALSLA